MFVFQLRNTNSRVIVMLANPLASWTYSDRTLNSDICINVCLLMSIFLLEIGLSITSIFKDFLRFRATVLQACWPSLTRLWVHILLLILTSVIHLLGQLPQKVTPWSTSKCCLIMFFASLLLNPSFVFLIFTLFTSFKHHHQFRMLSLTLQKVT